MVVATSATLMSTWHSISLSVSPVVYFVIGCVLYCGHIHKGIIIILFIFLFSMYTNFKEERTATMRSEKDPKRAASLNFKPYPFVSRRSPSDGLSVKRLNDCHWPLKHSFGRMQRQQQKVCSNKHLVRGWKSWSCGYVQSS